MLNQCTHSAVATSTASMSSQGPWLRISSALYKEFRASARAKPKGVALRPHRGDRLGLGHSLPVANGPVLHPTVGVVHQTRQLGPLTFPLPDGHSQGVLGQVGVQAGGGLPAMILREYTPVTKATYTHPEKART